jgi:MerR family redox-sensitive transcriptional activator SoxR
MAQRDVFDNHLPIGVVAERSGLAVSAIRFYESKGLVAAERTDGGQRRFRRDVLRRLAFIQAAQQVGLSLDDIGDALAALPAHAGPTPQQWSEMSARWRPLLDERIRLLERLRSDLEGCIGCGCLSMASCSLRNPFDQANEEGAGPRYLFGDASPG